VCPLWVIRADFVGIADSHTLYVGLRKKAKHDAQTLGADADESNVDFITGRNYFAPPSTRRGCRKTIAAASSLP